MEELIHKPNTNHLEWNESYYFVFQNLDHNIRGMCRMGFKPNKQEGSLFFLLFLPDNKIAGYIKKENIQNYSKNLKIGGMTFDPRKEGVWVYDFYDNMMLLDKPELFPKAQENPELISSIINVKLNLIFKPIKISCITILL